MIVTETKSLVSCHDFELNMARPTTLHYRVSYPSTGKAEAIVFIIPGFGEDTDSGYMDAIREYTAEQFHVVAVNVFYHCFYSRPNNGAALEFDNIDIAILQDVIARYEIDFSEVPQINKESVLEHLNKVFGARKQAKTMAESAQVMLPMTLVPHNGEYQNFGIMQAVDHLNVLLHIKQNLSCVTDEAITVMLGSSHGGYIAYLSAKIAPTLVNVVIDNSAYVTPPLPFIIGKEHNVNRPEYTVHYGHLRLHCFVRTLWTMNRQSPHYFSSDRYRIRDLTDSDHLQQHAEYTKASIRYIAYHSLEDTLASPQEKIAFYKSLQSLGFDAVLHTVDATKVDGRFIKTLEHGMGMSMKQLINQELPAILDEVTPHNQPLSEFTCKGDTLSYHFTLQTDALSCRCEDYI